MCTLGWNCRGAGQAATVRELDCLVQSYKPCIIFLCETRQSEERMRNLRFRLGMEGCYQVKGAGKGGGLALYWQDGITVDLLSYSNRHIDVHVSGGPYVSKWRASFVYGEPKSCDRHLMWTKMRQMKNRSNEPWLVLGDFNEAMWQEEHFSKSKRSERHMAEFRAVLSDCDLHDISFSGTPGRLIISREEIGMLKSDWIGRWLRRHGLIGSLIFGYAIYHRLVRTIALCCFQWTNLPMVGRRDLYVGMRFAGKENRPLRRRWRKLGLGGFHVRILAT
jgi:hypothetical protein